MRIDQNYTEISFFVYLLNKKGKNLNDYCNQTKEQRQAIDLFCEKQYQIWGKFLLKRLEKEDKTLDWLLTLTEEERASYELKVKQQIKVGVR